MGQVSLWVRGLQEGVSSKRQITFVISSLSAGGAERVMSIMANYWSAKEWDITILTFDDGSTPPFYNLDPQIKHTALGLSGPSSGLLEGVRNNLARILKLRKALCASKPEAVISFIDKTNVITLLAMFGQKSPVIVSEHSDPEQCVIEKSWDKLRACTYKLASRVVVLNDKAKSYFSSKIKKNIVVIPNPVVIEEKKSCMTNVGDRQLVVSMGRLSEEKGFDLLITAFAKLKDNFPGWSLVIMGEGPKRNSLEILRKKLGVSTCVVLPGNIKNPHTFLRSADLYVLSSRYEGFPCALCEAMACGLPVISTEYHSGVRDIITDGENGVLVPVDSLSSLVSAMECLMSDKYRRSYLGKNAKKIVEKYGPKKVMALWENILDDVL